MNKADVLGSYFCRNIIYIKGKNKTGVCGKLLLKAELSNDSYIETICTRCRSLQTVIKKV
jgi:hypothetical protein